MSANRATLHGAVAVVTGASRGIGRAIAAELAGAGATLVLAARSAELLASACGELRAAGAVASEAVFDLREVAAASQLRSQVLATHGRIDVLVNSAGATRVGDFLALSEDDYADGFALKFSAARRLCALFWPDLVSRGGSIVNVVGTAGRTPGIDYGIGGPVNAALLSLTKVLALRGTRDGVQVNAVNPGPTRTERFDGHLRRMSAEQGVSMEEAARRVVQTNGMTRFGTPQDTAALVRFIVSPEGRFLQGSLIDIDGGQTKSL